MLDTTFSTYQRSRGAARVAIGADGRLSGLFQQGSAKAMIPRTHGPAPEVVFLNTSGGLTGGDRLDFVLDVGAGTSVMGATQTAERAYASPGGEPARVKVALSAGEGATLFWLPQETILFERAALDRVTEVTLGVGARFLGIETIVLGRAHMGETLDHLVFNDARRIRDASGRLIHAEHLTIDDRTLADRTNPAALMGATVSTSITYVADDAGALVGSVRKHLPDSQRIAASGWDNRLVIRAMGDDSWALRASLLPALRHLTGGHLPRVWQL